MLKAVLKLHELLVQHYWNYLEEARIYLVWFDSSNLLVKM